MMDNQIKAALRGDKQAQAGCTAAEVLLPCPFCGGEAMKLGDFEFCNNHNQYFWYEQDELVCMIEIKDEKGIKWICGVYVSPTYRRRGIGTQLLQFATLLGGKKLTVARRNQVAFSLYQRFGFMTFDEDEAYFYMKLTQQEPKEAENE